MDKYFSARTSCRRFKKQEIPEKLLREIIEKAMKAPTCGNMQLYSVIATRKNEQKKKLSPFHFNQPASSTADTILTICADFHRFTKWCNQNNADAGFDNFHSFITALTDAVIFAQQIVTIAEREGLGTCYLGTVNYNAKEISELLELPDLVVPVASLALGYPDEDGEETERLPLNAILHEETYKEPSDTDIETFFRVKDEFEPNKKFVIENNKENLAQVISEVRYPREMNEKVSESFLNIIREKGFVNN